MLITSSGPRAASSSASARGVAGCAAPDLHLRLVEVDDRAPKAGALLVEHLTRALEPLARLVEAARERAQTHEPQPRIGVRVPKLGRDGLLAQVALDDVREVMAS